MLKKLMKVRDLRPIFQIMKGGNLRPQEIKDFLQASYVKNAPLNIDGYELDGKPSNLYGKVYVNLDLKKAVLAFRGTGMENLGTDWQTRDIN